MAGAVAIDLRGRRRWNRLSQWVGMGPRQRVGDNTFHLVACGGLETVAPCFALWPRPAAAAEQQPFLLTPTAPGTERYQKPESERK